MTGKRQVKKFGIIFFLALTLLFASACGQKDLAKVTEYTDHLEEYKVKVTEDSAYLLMKSQNFEERKIQGMEGLEGEIIQVLISHLDQLGKHEMGFDPSVLFLFEDGRLAWFLASEDLPAQVEFLPFIENIISLEENESLYARDKDGLTYDLVKAAAMTRIFEKSWNGSLFLDEESGYRIGGLLSFYEEGFMTFSMIEGWQEDDPLMEEWGGSYRFIMAEETGYPHWPAPLLEIDLHLTWMEGLEDLEGWEKKSIWLADFSPAGDMNLELVDGQSFLPLSSGEDNYQFWQSVH